ncbi:diguanylate cyclase/phosphodiesterase [Marinobacter santoriniensis NKSG1]|uniref:Diguanylate cyclase/phosphodiesterase n=1 Tax=Marinobacter santoriniensis NKSG1 TaxID=1288826 RepID=M7CLI7_9GAMM|nr:GGDEF domain-containing response regulator [Marinobacter santoriniensis]EMP54074.1 diguanylate cyclase/phosphodiesterase [Marinobacter santoriniensis NKSG1]
MEKREVIRVHIVDDDPADFLIIDELLQQSARFRFEISHISSWEDARQELIDPQCDLLLLDYFLGKGTARDLLIEARKIHCSVPIVVLTGVESVTLDDEVIELGASDFLPKGGINTALLERTIRHAIQHKRAELALERMAKRDPLTGLGNRLLFEEILESSLARCKRSGTRLAVLFMDLDRFKEINDSLGHPTGDLLLLLIADRLRSVIRQSDYIARIGGDEFTILIDDLHDAGDALSIARKIVQAISLPSAVGGHDLNVSASIGVALFPENGDAPIKLMQKSDIALYEAKRLGLNKVQCFTSNLQTQLEKHLHVEKGLRRALEASQFELLLQPKWSLADCKVIGFEALLRWRSENDGLISPQDFIPVAEKTGLIVPVGEWVLRQTLAYLERWNELGLCQYGIAVNVSPLQLKSGQFVDMLQHLLQEMGIAGEGLEVEITEETLLDGYEEDPRVQRDLSRIRELGVKIAIDDFGTGYSSLRYLRQFPADIVKIDKSFVSADQEDLVEPEICRAVVTMAESLGMEVIAEGIETQQQRQQLMDLGCRVGQGYLVSPPVSFDEATRLLLVPAPDKT